MAAAVRNCFDSHQFLFRPLLVSCTSIAFVRSWISNKLFRQTEDFYKSVILQRSKTNCLCNRWRYDFPPSFLFSSTFALFVFVVNQYFRHLTSIQIRVLQIFKIVYFFSSFLSTQIYLNFCLPRKYKVNIFYSCLPKRAELKKVLKRSMSNKN